MLNVDTQIKLFQNVDEPADDEFLSVSKDSNNTPDDYSSLKIDTEASNTIISPINTINDRSYTSMIITCIKLENTISSPGVTRLK